MALAIVRRWLIEVWAKNFAHPNTANVNVINLEITHSCSSLSTSTHHPNATLHQYSLCLSALNRPLIQGYALSEEKLRVQQEKLGDLFGNEKDNSFKAS
ncbi:MAG: hypothetical protein LAC70_00920 [Methylovulum sp.]|nr:hypothetical protein [Methylovulum sp.]TSA42229.1 MAG: hypothetical protein D4R63_00970 [Methylococcaceae bacterium]